MEFFRFDSIKNEYVYLVADEQEFSEPHAKDWIKIPEGSNIAIHYKRNDKFYFWKDEETHLRHDIWVDCKEYGMTTVTQFKDKWSDLIDFIWQREKIEVEDKKLDIKKVMAEAEMFDASNREHGHYYKDVSGLNIIDPYMVLKLFNVTDPCLQHIVKKALVAGGRGHKDLERDLKDIHDTAKRALEINNILH